MTSRIGNHIYAKDAAGAIRLYKAAFGLEEKGEPWLDGEGRIVHQDLIRKNGDLFIGVTDYNHLPNDAFIKKFATGACPPMLFYVFYKSKDELRRSFAVLSEGATLCRDLEPEGNDIVCEIIDKFGAFWHLRYVAQENQNAWNVAALFSFS